MVGKPTLPSDAETRPGLMGSSLDKHGNALDQERAASMADEGGAAGAIMDTREQFAAAASEADLRGSKRWPWVAASIGSAVLAATLVVGYRRVSRACKTASFA
jgi:hypothetical protein